MEELEIILDFNYDNLVVLLTELKDFHPFGCVIRENKLPQIIALDENGLAENEYIESITNYIESELFLNNISSGLVNFIVKYQECDAIKIKIISTNSDGWFNLILKYHFDKMGNILFEDYLSIQ